MGSGCGLVGRVVASDSRGRWFGSSNWKNLHGTFVYCQLYWKDKNKEKEDENGQFFIKTWKREGKAMCQNQKDVKFFMQWSEFA